jgi:leucyl aminopeptidase
VQIEALMLCLPAGADHAEVRGALQRVEVVVEATNYTRGLANLPGNVVFPSALAEEATRMAEECGLECTVLDKPSLTRRGFGGLLAVGGGSSHDPRLIMLRYAGSAKRGNPRGGKGAQGPVVFVGKAITFDSGGISIKPSERMEDMKFDKCGGVAVLGIMRAVAKLQLPVPVIGLIASAENLLSATSYRPGDIVTSYRGPDKTPVTVEVINTDAEGRIVLGDALAFAREHKPSVIVDVATLTGACVVALGPYAAGLMGNDEPLQTALRQAGERTGERLWPLPLWAEHRDRIKSDVANIKNTAGREGATMSGGAFLERYVGKVPWAHLDIAGVAWTNEERPYLLKGATGFGVRLLLEWLRAR